MKKMKCVHPRKAQRLMAEFLNNASDLYCLDGDGEDYVKTEILIKKDSQFCAESVDCVADCEELTIYYNFNELWDKSMKLFRAYWTDKAPILKGFANITLTLLHELGHLETSDEIRKEFPFAMRTLAWYAVNEFQISDLEKNLKYFAFPDEAAATQWGINWLADKEHRKMAKKFEKKFLACFK